MTSIKSIHQKLGLNTSNGLFVYDGDGQPFIKKINKLFDIKELRPHSIFCLGQKPFILFYENPTNKEAIFKAVWNLNEVPIIIISEANTINIYNGFEYLKKNASLASIGTEDHLTDFEYFKLVTGKTWAKYEKELSYKNRVDYKLLENIKDTRSILMDDCGLDNHDANSLLGKCIFTRYLIDRHVRIGFDSEPREWTTEDFCQILARKKSTLEFFKYLQEQFNGDLFPFDESNIDQNSLNIVIDLLRGTKIKTGQLSLFDVFDFSIIPVEFISNVYELFIGQEEQAKRGAYYTPLFLVEYIISQTVQKHFSDGSKSYNCKILDPACGSGIFLVEALRVIIERFNSIHPALSRGTKEYREGLRKLAEDNIFGIDKDKTAISIAMFSVYLTLLDYQRPRDIENFKFPKLLDKNFFRADFFDLDHSFNEGYKKIQFDFIIGNPPWKRGSGKGKKIQLFEEYIKKRKEHETKKEIPIGISNKEIAQAFLLRTSDFSSLHTKAALIVTSKTLYNLNARAFRKYFLTYYLIEKVFELSPVRREVFNKSNAPAIAPPAIIFYKYSFEEKTDSNQMLHYSLKPSRFFSLFNLLIVHRNDVKTVKQGLLKKHDWLWKTLLYGHYLDYDFLLRLSRYETIKERIAKKKYLKGQGFQIGSDLNPVGDLGKLKLLTPNCVTPFKTYYNFQPFAEQSLHRVRKERLYYGTRLLIKKGLNNNLKSVAAICQKDCLFKDSITAIRIFNKDDISDLRIISGLLQSDLFSYYALHKFSSIGVEREQSFNKEKFAFPFIENDAISNTVETIENDLSGNTAGIFRKPIAPSLIKKLNSIVSKSFNLSNAEIALIDYSVNYLIPSITKRNDNKKNYAQLVFKDKFIDGYINVFYSKFSSIFNNSRSFQVEVWYAEHIIGLFFKVIPHGKKSSNSIEWKNKNNNDLLKALISLGHEKITDKLFIQKDIRGFEKNSFYIFKPNEKRMWHKALAYLDLNDFVDAILKVGNQA